jgi:hypothetical protein
MVKKISFIIPDFRMIIRWCKANDGTFDFLCTISGEDRPNNVLRLKYRGLAISMDFPGSGMMDKDEEDGFGFQYLC